jgi:salicylate hydroxylase
MTHADIIIAGAGIAGLAAAIALKQRDVLVLEQAPAFSPIGAGIQLGPNAARALQALDAWDAVSPVTSSPPEIHMRDGVTGRLLKRLKLGQTFEQRFGAPYRVARRADLHSALLNIVTHQKQTHISLSHTITSVTSNTTVNIEASLQTFQAKALIATDGVHSVTRQILFPNTKPVDAGATYHRALIPTPNVTGVEIECVNLWMFPKGHVVHYPVGIPQQLNLIAITPLGTDPHQHFANATPQLHALLSQAQRHLTPWPSFYTASLKTWCHNNTLLLGDAAHAAVPYLAQGAAMSLEDAACLKNVMSRNGAFTEQFKSIEQLRKTRTETLQHASLKAGKAYHASGIIRHARNAVLKAMPAETVQARLTWIYRG